MATPIFGDSSTRPLLGQPLVLFIILTLVEERSSLAGKIIAASLYGLFIIALYAISMAYIKFIQKT